MPVPTPTLVSTTKLLSCCTFDSPSSEPDLTPLGSVKRSRSPELIRISPLDQELHQNDSWTRPPSPKRRTPRLSIESAKGSGTPTTSRKDSTKGRPQKWTPAEDKCLREAVDRYGARNWRAIATMVPGRTHTQCLQHWSKVLKPGLVKGNWSKEEDHQLSYLVRSFSAERNSSDFEQYNRTHDYVLTREAALAADWTYISDHVTGRTTKQCRERWFHHLDPSLKHGPFDEDEDNILLTEHAVVGSKWSQIASKLRGRTADAVKIRYITLSRLRASGRPLRPPPIVQFPTRSPDEASGTSGHAIMIRCNSESSGYPQRPLLDEQQLSRSSSMGSIQERSRTSGILPSSHQREEEKEWIEELAWRLSLPLDAKMLIQAKCASLEQELRRPLQACEREKVAKVIREACNSVSQGKTETKTENKSPNNQKVAMHAALGRRHLSEQSHICCPSSPLSLHPDLTIGTHTMKHGMKKSSSTSSVNSANSLSCPSSPLHFVSTPVGGMGGAGGGKRFGVDDSLDSAGLNDCILDLDLEGVFHHSDHCSGSSINNSSNSSSSSTNTTMAETSFLQELQELDNLDLKLSTDLQLSSECGSDMDTRIQKENALADEVSESGVHDAHVHNHTVVPVACSTPRVNRMPHRVSSANQCNNASFSSQRPILGANVDMDLVSEWAYLFAPNDDNGSESVAQQSHSVLSDSAHSSDAGGSHSHSSGLMCV